MILATAMFVAAGYFAWQYLELRRENQELLRNKDQLTIRYAEQNEKLNESLRTLKRLREDPEFVEMAIRRRLGYAKAGELIYNFETPSPAETPLSLPIITDTTAPAPRQPRPQR